MGVLIWNLGFDELRQQRERFLPAEVARLRRYDARQAFLHNVQLRPAGYFFERYRRLHFSGQIRVIEFVCVANVLVWLQLDISPAEGMALAGSEIRKRHLVGATDLCIHLMNLSVNPFGGSHLAIASASRNAR